MLKKMVKSVIGKKCVYCAKKFNGRTVIEVSNEEFAHPFCHYKHHPYQERDTFREVLSNHDHPVLVNDLLQTMIPVELQYKVIDAFNQIMTERRKKRNTKYFD